GLQSSPAHSLAENVDGFVDYLDMHGRALGGGGSVPGDMAYTRRWSIARIDSDANLIALRACVWERAHLAGAPEVCLSTARARRP
ncbi:MAG: hypothetical protein LC791_15555, partial [Acidobacteria bacterium]|nr:hypothetical protein [Acidobacteriota bacterium]